MFYPADPGELHRMVERFLSGVKPHEGPSPKAVISPHAGYIYSGPIAASAYACIQAQGVRRVVLLGPSPHAPVRGLAASSADAWRTPLGEIPVEYTGLDHLQQVETIDAAHAREHSLEVQLPFLQVVLGHFTLAPFAVGDASAEQVAEVLETLWGGPETLIVISSDLSHYESYRAGRAKDTAASRAIVGLNPRGLDFDNACGLVPIAGLLHLAKKKGMRAELMDLRSSGDTAGPKDQVVGYGAYAFYE